MIDITLENFQSELIDGSMTTPVLLDIWAEWCGPCKQLGPVLEKLETEYAGRFTLAKLDADKVPQISQQLSQMFGVRSIPFCVMFKDGQPVDGFVGAIPAAEIRTFLDKHVPAAEELEAAAEEEAAQTALAEGDTEGALEKLQAIDFATPATGAAPVLAELDAKIAATKRDFQARFDRARLLMAAQRWPEAMDELLEILMRDKAWNDELARKAYIAVLEIIEPPKVKVADGQIPPVDPTVSTYRRRLSSVVLS
ncbi:MAG: tetratricopeptide repeat protein [Variovorax sp.]|nr:MAG: tetratricopeptide repeat protein [Variovorax sp.]